MMNFISNEQVAELVVGLRQRLDALLQAKVDQPHTELTQGEE